MDIAEFLEQDMLIFLDDRLDKKSESVTRADKTASTMFFTRDYEKELTAALSQENIAAAKQTLNALKDQLDECPAGPDKEQLKALLLSLYEKFKDYIDAHHLAISDPTLGLKTQPNSAAQPPTQPVQASTPQAPPSTPVTPVSVPASAAISASQDIEKTDSGVPDIVLKELQNIEGEIESALQRGDRISAMRAYRRARAEIQSWSSVPPEYTKKYLEYFNRIQESPASTLNRDLLFQLEQEKRVLDTRLHEGNMQGAMEQYQRMKLLAQQLSDPVASAEARAKLQRIFTIINSMKTTSMLNEQQLARPRP